MAAIGSLYLNRGEWALRRIISAEWIAESTSRHSAAIVKGAEFGYGFFWWIRESDGETSFFASGDGGNMIWCSPGKKASIAIISHFMPDSRDRVELIERLILPIL